MNLLAGNISPSISLASVFDSGSQLMANFMNNAVRTGQNLVSTQLAQEQQFLAERARVDQAARQAEEARRREENENQKFIAGLLAQQQSADANAASAAVSRGTLDLNQAKFDEEKRQFNLGETRRAADRSELDAANSSLANLRVMESAGILTQEQKIEKERLEGLIGLRTGNASATRLITGQVDPNVRFRSEFQALSAEQKNAAQVEVARIQAETKIDVEALRQQSKAGGPRAAVADNRLRTLDSIADLVVQKSKLAASGAGAEALAEIDGVINDLKGLLAVTPTPGVPPGAAAPGAAAPGAAAPGAVAPGAAAPGAVAPGAAAPGAAAPGAAAPSRFDAALAEFNKDHATVEDANAAGTRLREVWFNDVKPQIFAEIRRRAEEAGVSTAGLTDSQVVPFLASKLEGGKSVLDKLFGNSSDTNDYGTLGKTGLSGPFQDLETFAGFAGGAAGASTYVPANAKLQPPESINTAIQSLVDPKIQKEIIGTDNQVYTWADVVKNFAHSQVKGQKSSRATAAFEATK